MSSHSESVNTPVAKDWCLTKLDVKKFIYEWTIQHFSLRCEAVGKYVESSQFPLSNDVPKWTLRVYPRGSYAKAKECLDLYIVSHNESTVTAKITISILNVRKEKCNTVDLIPRTFTKESTSYAGEYVSRSTLLQKDSGLLPLDALTILCEVSVVNDISNICGQSNIIPDKVPKNKLSEDLGGLFAKEKFSDVKLLANGHELKAHKAILAARSQVFSAMFEHELEEQKSNSVLITDVDHEVLQEMLRYMYTDKTPNLNVMAGDLLAAADKYAMKNLKIKCELALRLNMTVEKAAMTLILADRHNSNQLKTKTIDFIISNATGVMKTQGWKDMRSSCPHLVEEVFCAIAQQLNIN